MGKPSETRSWIAAKANDLGAIQNSLIDAASVSAGLWLSYLFAIFYLFVAAAGVTHLDLLLDHPIVMPFLSLNLPLRGFFWLGPILLLILHAYVLLHFSLLARKVVLFDTELRNQIDPELLDSPWRASLRRQLPINIFVQILAGPSEIRQGRLGILLRIIAWISLVLAPIFLLIFLELQFLPYHDAAITWFHRISVFFDLLLIWLLWPGIMHFGNQEQEWLRVGKATAYWMTLLMCALFVLLSPTPWYVKAIPTFLFVLSLMMRHFGGRLSDPTEESDIEQSALDTGSSSNPWMVSIPRPFLILLSVGSLVMVFAVANFPGEWLESTLAWFPFRHTLIDGDDDFITRRPTSLWSNHLVLPGLLIPTGMEPISLRGRQLARANFIGADLKGSDFEGANLRGVSFDRTRLQGARFNRARLQGAKFIAAQLDGATFFRAQLEGATFQAAYLIGASFKQTNLSATGFNQARLQDALFDEATLLGTSLDKAQLQGASFRDATLSTVSITGAFVWRADIRNLKQLDFARIGNLEQRPDGFSCNGADDIGIACDGADSLKAIKELIDSDSLLPYKNKEIIKNLNRLSIVGSKFSPPSEDEVIMLWWKNYSDVSEYKILYSKNIFKTIEKIGCDHKGAPFVIDTIIRRIFSKYFHSDDNNDLDWMEKDVGQLRHLVNSFRGGNCAGARGLPTDSRAVLAEFLNRQKSRQ